MILPCHAYLTIVCNWLQSRLAQVQAERDELEDRANTSGKQLESTSKELEQIRAELESKLEEQQSQFRALEEEQYGDWEKRVQLLPATSVAVCACESGLPWKVVVMTGRHSISGFIKGCNDGSVAVLEVATVTAFFTLDEPMIMLLCVWLLGICTVPNIRHVCNTMSYDDCKRRNV